ncbi:alpha/beta fold hydrolase [Nocardia panacis]|uniref:Alpha/beta fold hydrolase n=1 Tax=Nocardia panacis TaxID=2340916 RepID=A0A3A4KFH1_9NOCA|nr:alpha/beta fold hydrolase [Nocardia panacis]RJO72086.1 alpha/beta fold hydrolase [Nocardia panacis]
MRRAVLLAATMLTCLYAPSAGAAPFERHDGVVAPPGANDWNCVPTPAHPLPVILLHGTWDNQNAWNVLAPRLAADGYCVFTLNYGRDSSSVLGSQPRHYASGDIAASAREVGEFVDRVRTATGAARVALLGHSQGAVVARQYVRFEGGRHKVGKLISLVGTNHGTTQRGLIDPRRVETPLSPERIVMGFTGIAAYQQLVGSEFLRELNADGDTEPGIAYTVIASRFDDASAPPEATFLAAGPGATVDNVMVQDLCPSDRYDHASLPQSPTVGYIVERALDPGYRGNPC